MYVHLAMPALFERGGKSYGHYLDGDGYVIKLTIQAGENNGDKKVHFTSRFVETEEFLAEKVYYIPNDILYTIRYTANNDILYTILYTYILFYILVY